VNFIGFIGTTEAVPCYKTIGSEFFSSLFSPFELFEFGTWGFAPGWDKAGLRP